MQMPYADALFKELQLGEARLEATDFMVLAPPSTQQICLPLHSSGLASLTVKLNRLDSALCRFTAEIIPTPTFFVRVNLF